MCLWTERQPYMDLKLVKSRFEKCVQAVHSNAFPYFTGLPVSLSLYRRYSSRVGLHNSASYSASPLTRCNNLSLAGKRPVRIKLPLTQIQYLREVLGFRSAGHILHHCIYYCTLLHAIAYHCIYYCTSLHVITYHSIYYCTSLHVIAYHCNTIAHHCTL